MVWASSDSLDYAAQQAWVQREELIERVARAVPEADRVEALPGLFLFRASAPSKPLHSVYDPAFCMLAQGAKVVFVGEERYQYDPQHYLLTTVELPVVSHILVASPQRPYLSVRLRLDPALVGAALVEAGIPPLQSGGAVKAIDVSPLDNSLLDAMVRLVRLVETPSDARVLAPLIKREIIHRLLTGDQGARLRQIAVLGGSIHSMSRVVDWLRQEFNKPLHVESIAQELGMSVSGLYHQFKAVTAMSPLQFQKRLRLQEARRLMLGENLDATSAGQRVGYIDPAHFSREYKSLFGLPPLRDVERLRETNSQNTLQAVVEST